MIVEYVRTYLEMTDPANLCQPPTRLVRAHNDIVSSPNSLGTLGSIRDHTPLRPPQRRRPADRHGRPRHRLLISCQAAALNGGSCSAAPQTPNNRLPELVIWQHRQHGPVNEAEEAGTGTARRSRRSRPCASPSRVPRTVGMRAGRRRCRGGRAPGAGRAARKRLDQRGPRRSPPQRVALPRRALRTVRPGRRGAGRRVADHGAVHRVPRDRRCPQRRDPSGRAHPCVSRRHGAASAIDVPSASLPSHASHTDRSSSLGGSADAWSSGSRATRTRPSLATL